MKSYNHLYEKYLSEENYRLAMHNALRNRNGKKSKKRRIRYFKENEDALIGEIIEYAGNYRNARHVPKLINDGISKKQRKITIPTIKEQIVHHMVINVMKPIFLKSMYEHSYASIPGRGMHIAKKRIEKWIKRKDKNMKYCLKMDIKKYFESIPHDIIKKKLALLIHDDRFLTIMNEIIDVMPEEHGIPIGFYTSQWLANWYLTELDHYIKEELRAKYYVRYLDDMVIFDASKKRLHQMKWDIENYLDSILGLKLKDNWQVFLFDYKNKNDKTIGCHLDFMGFRFYRNRTTLRKRILLSICRKARRISKKGKVTIHDCYQILSYLGWIKCSDVYNVYLDRIKSYISIGNLKKKVSLYNKNLNKEGSVVQCGIK